MISLLAIPCCVMNLASRSDAEDSNALEITGFGALISELAKLLVRDAFAIVSQGNDKVFTLKMAGYRLFRRLFPFNQLARHDHRVFDDFIGRDLHLVRQNGSSDARARADFDVVPEYRIRDPRGFGD